jgi:hypothetical protein
MLHADMLLIEIEIEIQKEGTGVTANPSVGLPKLHSGGEVR